MSERTQRTANRMTAQEFLRLPENGGYRYELVRGRLVREKAPGFLHGWLTSWLSFHLVGFVLQHDLGYVVTDTRVTVARDPDTVRQPDLAFITKGRLKSYPETEVLLAVPDLCIEILSPSNRASDMLGKVTEYLDGGARLVWLIDGVRKTAVVYRSRSDIRILGIGDVLDGHDVLPGFTLPLALLFTT